MIASKSLCGNTEGVSFCFALKMDGKECYLKNIDRIAYRLKLSFSSTNVRKPTATCNSSSKASNMLLWPP